MFMLSEQAGDPDSFTEELENIINKKFAFKIQITDYNLREGQSTYSVFRISDNADLLDALDRTVDDNPVYYQYIFSL